MLDIKITQANQDSMLAVQIVPSTFPAEFFIRDLIKIKGTYKSRIRKFDFSINQLKINIPCFYIY